jgi:hypothetical protein
MTAAVGTSLDAIKAKQITLPDAFDADRRGNSRTYYARSTMLT